MEKMATGRSVGRYLCSSCKRDDGDEETCTCAKGVGWNILQATTRLCCMCACVGRSVGEGVSFCPFWVQGNKNKMVFAGFVCLRIHLYISEFIVRETTRIWVLIFLNLTVVWQFNLLIIITLIISQEFLVDYLIKMMSGHCWTAKP